MVKISDWMKATRPKTLIASVSPILIGTAMAIGKGEFHLWVFFFTLLTGLGIQISTNVINDLYDFLKGADTTSRKGPLRITQAGLGILSLQEVKKATLALVSFTAISGSILIFRGGILIACLVLLALLLAFAYTAGPFPLSYLGIAEIFILVFFGPVATGATYYLQTLTFSLSACIAGLAPGLLSCAILAMQNLRDIEEDRVAKKKTLVVRLGTSFGKGESLFAILTACLVPLFFYKEHPFVLTTTLCLLPAAFLLFAIGKVKDPHAYIPLFNRTGKLLSLYTFIFCLSYLL